MPLTRANVTAASRIMLPLYVAAATYIGCCYLFSPAERLRGPSLAVARMLLPMPVWGMIALGLAAVLVVSMTLGRREPAVVALCVGAVAYVCWSAFYGVSIFIDPAASLVSPVWPLVAAGAHVASAVSLSRDERQ